jgi:uncharacterized tellurite resistance protein B-like protein
MKSTFMAWLGLDKNEESDSGVDTNRAAAALMAEVMAVDHDWHELEIERIESLMQESLGLDAAEARQIVSEVLEQQKSQHDLFQFTSAINQEYSQDQKFELLKSLWRVAYADGRVDAYEEHIIRRLADLIHMPHNQFIKAKIDARDIGRC